MTFFVCKICKKRVNENPEIELYLRTDSRGFPKKTRHYLEVCRDCQTKPEFDKLLDDMTPSGDDHDDHEKAQS